MGVMNWFGLDIGEQSGKIELPEIFPFDSLESDFVYTDVQNIYSRILTEVLERTSGIPDKYMNLLWDNCLASESQDGLVTMITKAMVSKSDLFLVFDRGTDVIRRATQEESRLIRDEYQNKAQSNTGIYITFKNYKKTDMIKLYSSLEYCTLASLSKSMNLSKAIQIKIKDLRGSVSLIDSTEVKAQGKLIAESLKKGKDIAIDAGDIIETASPDLTATKASMEFIANKQSFYLGLPASWIMGDMISGMSDTGQADAKAVERGLKSYYFQIIKPVIEDMFEVKTSFKSDDFLSLTTSLQALKDFELTSNELISMENKLSIVNKLFGLPENSKGDEPEEVEAPTPPVEEPIEGQDDGQGE